MKSYRKLPKNSFCTLFLPTSFSLRTTVKISLVPKVECTFGCALPHHTLISSRMCTLALVGFLVKISYSCPRIRVSENFTSFWMFCSFLLLILAWDTLLILKLIQCVQSSLLRPCKPEQPTFTLSLNQWGHYKGRCTVVVTVHTRQWAQSSTPHFLSCSLFRNYVV